MQFIYCTLLSALITLAPLQQSGDRVPTSVETLHKVNQWNFRIPEDVRANVLALIGRLGSIPSNYKEFVARPEMSQLLGFGIQAYPLLREELLRDGSSSMQITAAYLLYCLGGQADPVVRVRVEQLLFGENAELKLMVETIFRLPSEEGTSSFTGVSPMDRLELWRQNVDWVSEEDCNRLLTSASRTIEDGSPYIVPAVWRTDGGGYRTDLDPAAVSQAGFREVNTTYRFAEKSFKTLFSSRFQHSAIALLLERLAAEGGQDEATLGRKLGLAVAALFHKCDDQRCKENLREQLLDACMKWAWKTSDPCALRNILSICQFTLPNSRAMELLKSLTEKHSNEEVRLISEGFLKDFTRSSAWFKGDASRLRKEQARDAALKRRSEVARKSKAEPTTPQGPASGAPNIGEADLSWLLVASIVVASALAAWLVHRNWHKTRTT